jgi:hypothetical protein
MGAYSESWNFEYVFLNGPSPLIYRAIPIKMNRHVMGVRIAHKTSRRVRPLSILVGDVLSIGLLDKERPEARVDEFILKDAPNLL